MGSLGVLLLETSFMDVAGAMKHPETFAFPALHSVVPGATGQTVVGPRTAALTDAYVAHARTLVEEGADVLTCNCGFAVTFQDAIVTQARRPAITSSLLLVPLLARVFGSPVGVLTYDAAQLDAARRQAAGWAADLAVAVADVQHSEAWRALGAVTPPSLDLDVMREDLLTTARALSRGASPTVLLLECTGMFPFAQILRDYSEVPVFDLNDFLRFLVPIAAAARRSDRGAAEPSPSAAPGDRR